MRDSPERDLAVAQELGYMADARIKELEQTSADLRQVVRMCLQQFEFTYGKRQRGWDARYLMARCGTVLGTVDEKPSGTFDIDASLKQCLEAIRKRRAEVDRTAIQNMGLPDQHRPTWTDVDHLLQVIDRMEGGTW